MELPENEFFLQKTGIIAGDECVLVTPSYKTPTWDDLNKIFRSSIWTKDGKPVSLGFRKFTNLGEQPDFEPLPDGKLTFVGKEDGTLLIVSKYIGELITRTRGTFEASKLPNGKEIELLKIKYPNAFKVLGDISLLYEWTTPSNEIVIKHQEPKLFLVGVVEHKDYSYWKQEHLDILAEYLGVSRPKTYTFDSIEDALKQVESWNDSEGIVIYSEDGQILKKIKSDWYLKQHYFKTGFRSLKKAVDVWLSLGAPKSREEFFTRVSREYDYEVATILEEYINEISAEVLRIINKYEDAKVLLEKQPAGRKERALWIQSHDDDDEFKKLAFLELSGRGLSDEQIAKMIKDSA